MFGPRAANRTNEIAFDDGARFELPCEYLRVYSPSAEVRGHGPGQEVLQVGKENVNIERIDDRDEHSDFIGLFELIAPFYGQSTDFFWV